MKKILTAILLTLLVGVVFVFFQKAGLEESITPEESNELDEPLELKESSELQLSPNLEESIVAQKVSDWVKKADLSTNTDPTFGVMGAVSLVTLNKELDETVWLSVRSEGVSVLYKDASLLKTMKNILQERIESIVKPLAAEGTSVLRDVQNLPWGMVEVEKGDDEYALSDFVIREVQAAGADYVATVMPFADWDMAGLEKAPELCEHFFEEDYPYLAAEGKMGRTQDLEAFTDWLGRMVERYDGDGIDDAPGLTRGVKYWQIHNEPEGTGCGGFENDVNAYVTLMEASYEAVKTACSDCLVLNGGAGRIEPGNEGGDFWVTYADLGGAEYIDVIALHYNNGKTTGGDIQEFEDRISYIKKNLGSEKPVWVTEFGVFIGEAGGPFIALPEEEAGAWLLRFYTAGLASGVELFISDAPTFITDGKVSLPFYLNKLLELKLDGFTQAEKIDDGQYRFLVDENWVYILWNGVPDSIKNESIEITSMFGETFDSFTELSAPSETFPLIVEVL